MWLLRHHYDGLSALKISSNFFLLTLAYCRNTTKIHRSTEQLSSLTSVDTVNKKNPTPPASMNELDNEPLSFSSAQQNKPSLIYLIRVHRLRLDSLSLSLSLSLSPVTCLFAPSFSITLSFFLSRSAPTHQCSPRLWSLSVALGKELASSEPLRVNSKPRCRLFPSH